MPTTELIAVTAKALSVPTHDPFVIASGAVHATRSVLVEVALRRGAQVERGLGEGACLPPVTAEDQGDALAAVTAAAERLVGLKVSSLQGLPDALEAVLPGKVGRAAVEVAVLDALARLERVPVWKLVGPEEPKVLDLETDITIPILAPERMAALAAQWWAKGFRALKVKVGKNLEADLRALGAIARVTPKARFRLDANGGLKVEEAVALAAEAAKLGAHLECFEQPCATVEELVEVTSRLDVPVLADESAADVSGIERLAALGAVDGVNLKIVKAGSYLRALAMGHAALSRGMELMVGGMVETRLGMTAATHLAASLGGVTYADLDTAWLLTEDPFSGGYQENGPMYVLSDAPGLGVSLRQGV